MTLFTNTKVVTIIVLGVLLVAGLQGYAYFTETKNSALDAASSELVPGTVVTTGDNNNPTINLSPDELPKVGESITKDGYTITNEGIDEGSTVVQGEIDLSKIPTPNFSTIPKKPATMQHEVYAQITGKMQPIIVDIQKQIDTNKATGSQTLYTDGWLDLALYRNMLGDVAGAKEVWVYLTKASPGLVQPYGNMANQYLVEQNFVEAEKWYKIAIQKMPQALQHYQDLSDVYIAQKRTADAVAILKAGIAVDSKSWSLQVTLGRLYLAQGDGKSANIQFDAAIARAKAAGNTAAVEAIQQEKR